MSDVVQHYESSLPIWIEKDGFSRPPLLALHHDGERTMASLMVPPQMIFRVVMTKFMCDLTIKEIIFGIDHYTKPGQGTKYKDVLAVFWWQGERVNEHLGWQFGVVNYRPPPRTLIEPIDWHNAFWNDISLKIVEDYYHRTIRAITEAAAQPGGDELVTRLRQAVTEARERAERRQKQKLH
jgi:hypothetical protein